MSGHHQLRTFADLFCGIGGFHLGLRREGLNCVFASEIDRATAEYYAANTGRKPFGDIRHVKTELIPPADVLTAGFPCQPFSMAGRKGGMADKRGNLFLQVIRCARAWQPKVMVLENTEGILSADEGSMMAKIYQLLDCAGYRVWHEKLNASLYGIPQQRERVYFACVRKDVRIEWHPPLPTYEECGAGRH